MITKTLKNFSIRQIDRSGQCFRMEELGEGRYGVTAADRYVEVCQAGEVCTFSCSDREFDGFWQQYFDLDTDYGNFLSQIDPEDAYLSGAARRGSGIRILRQDLWEMIVTFLISQQNNIVRIRRCVRNICERYGERKYTPEGISYYAFPSPRALADASEEELRACNLGYRSKYVLRTAQSIVREEVSLSEVSAMPYQEARTELLKLYGIGGKVADCICLFALHQLEAFPVDTHIRQALENHYPDGFPHERYGAVQGVMQQYIFYQELFPEEES